MMRPRPLAGRAVSRGPSSSISSPPRGLYNELARGGGHISRDYPASLGPLAWFDASDISTLYQDTAQTIPVTADGDPVGFMADKSGNNLFVTQSTAGSRPTYRTSGGLHWLEFDGSADYLANVAPALRVVGDLTLVVGVLKVTAAAFGPFISCQTNAGTINQYEFRASNAGTATVATNFVGANGSTSEAETCVLLTQDAAAVLTAARTVGSTVATTVNETGLADTDSDAHTMIPTSNDSSEFRLGSRKGSANFLNGRIYQALVFGRLLTAAEKTALIAYVAEKTGVTI
jgi:hypothetical protein